MSLGGKSAAEILKMIDEATDEEWYAVFELCGGCGEDCGCDGCVGKYCQACPERKAEGRA